MLAFHERLTLTCGDTPVPVTDSVLLELVAVVKVKVAEAAPLVVGAYTTFN